MYKFYVLDLQYNNREVLRLKRSQTLFKTLGETSKPNAILATNTSSLSVNEMASASGVPHRVCGLHFFNPVQVMKVTMFILCRQLVILYSFGLQLVEIVKADDTSPEVITAVTEFVQKTRKVEVHCGDTPGFIVNRLLVRHILFPCHLRWVSYN